jgi:hypothetical protein
MFVPHSKKYIASLPKHQPVNAVKSLFIVRNATLCVGRMQNAMEKKFIHFEISTSNRSQNLFAVTLHPFFTE